MALARERGYVSEFVRFSPLFPHFATAYGAAAATLTTRCVATIAADLRDGADGYWRRAAKQHRNKVRKARKRGVAVAMSVVETAADVASFRDLYGEPMDRRRASRFYYFDEAYYAALVAELPRGDCYYATATAPDGSLVSAAIFLRHGAALHYHLSGSRAAGYALAGPSAILDAAARLGAALGCATLHLGGGLRPGDALATFKRAVGDVVLDWTLGTSVLLREARAWGRRRSGRGKKRRTRPNARHVALSPSASKKARCRRRFRDSQYLRSQVASSTRA